MIRPSREVLILAAGLLVAAGGAYSLMRPEGGEASAAVVKRAARVYDTTRPVTEPYAAAELKAYWLGVDVTSKKRKKTEGEMAPLEPITVPLPPVPVLAAPPLRPWPLANPPRPLPLIAAAGAAPAAAPAGAAPAGSAPPGSAPPGAAPAAAPAVEGGAVARPRPTIDHLLPTAEFDALLELPEPPDEAVVDRRAEKVREFVLLHLKDGKVLEGTIRAETKDSIIFRNQRGGIQQTIKMAQVKKIERAWTNEEQYRADTEAVPAGDVAARLKLAAWCLEKGMLPEATAEYEKVVAAKAGDVSAALALAALYRRGGRFEEELKTLRAAAEKGTSSREKAWLALAGFYRYFGLLDEALKAARTASKVAPGHAESLTVQAELELEAGLLEKALDTAKKAIDRSKGAPRAVTVRLGALVARGDLDRASVELERLASGSGPPHAPALNLLGVVRFLRGSYAESVQAFALAAKTDPALVPAITNLGVIYLLAGQVKEAGQIFALAAARDPADATPLVGQALCAHLEASRAPAAPAPGAEAATAPAAAPADTVKVQIEKALAVDPQDAYAEYAAGMTAYRLRVPEEAERRLRIALRGGTGSVPVLYALGAVLVEAGHGAEAEVCFARIVGRGDASAEEQVSLAIARCARKAYAAAAEDLQRLVVAHPRMVHVWNALAYLDYMHHRKVKDAISKLKQALTCDSTNQWALVTLHKIVEETTTIETADDFNRPDADEVGQLWLELENTGVDIRIVDQRCHFAGVQKLNDWVDTAIEREVAGETFKQFAAELDFREMDRVVAGIRVTYAAIGSNVTKSILVARDDRGRFVHANVTSTTIIPRWKVTPEKVTIPPLEGNPVGPTGKPLARFKIVAPPLDDNARYRTFDCYVNNVKIGSLQTSLRDQAVRYTVAVFARAMKNVPIEFTADNVQIKEHKLD